MLKPEAAEQTALFLWAEWAKAKYPELALMYHIPNGGSRNKLEAANLKRQGVKAGIPDICLPAARCKYHGMYIEMKAGKNKPTKKQKEILCELAKQGYKTAVCYSWQEAQELILNYLNEVNE